MKTLTMVLCREGKKYLSPLGQKSLSFRSLWKCFINCCVAHEEEKTQNKYKLVLCVGKYYQKRKRTRENKNNTYIYIYIYVYTQRKKKY